MFIEAGCFDSAVFVHFGLEQNLFDINLWKFALKRNKHVAEYLWKAIWANTAQQNITRGWGLNGYVVNNQNAT